MHSFNNTLNPLMGQPINNTQHSVHAASSQRRNVEFQPSNSGTYESNALFVGASLGREHSFSQTHGNDDKMNDVPSIKNVWFENFEDELPVISDLLEKYPYIAMVNTYI